LRSGIFPTTESDISRHIGADLPGKVRARAGDTKPVPIRLFFDEVKVNDHEESSGQLLAVENPSCATITAYTDEELDQEIGLEFFDGAVGPYSSSLPLALAVYQVMRERGFGIGVNQRQIWFQTLHRAGQAVPLSANDSETERPRAMCLAALLALATTSL
jgi:hypothetical protein